MNLPLKLAAKLSLGSLLLAAAVAHGDDASIPKFTIHGVALHPDDLNYSPNDDLIHPTVVKVEGRVENPLGRYYLYHAPHKHISTSLAYADSLAGPWTEYENNPVIEGPSAPDIRWIEEAQKFFMWGHTKNSKTELWTSEDGIHFEHHGDAVTAAEIGTRNATYSRVYEYPIEKYGNRYIMLYSGFIEDRGIRCIWLAHSKDAIHWTQLKEPLVEPIEGEMNDCYGPALLQWKGRNLITYQDHTNWRGGNLKFVEIDKNLTPVGAGGERRILIDPPAAPPLNDRFRGTEFYYEGDTLYLISSGSKDPRLLLWGTAPLEGTDPKSDNVTEKDLPAKPKARSDPERNKPPGNKKSTKAAPLAPSTSLDEVLRGHDLETVYETSFDEAIRLIREEELLEGGKFARAVPEGIDWVLEGPGEIETRDGRLVFKNDPSGNAVLWNTREFPENFVAEWDFQHHHQQGLAILFFAAQGEEGGSIFSAGLPRRGGNFGNYTGGRIHTYHTSYTAIEVDGTLRGTTHLKKDGGENPGKAAAGPAPITGPSEQPHRLRLAKLNNRIILEIDGQVSFDWTDSGETRGAPYGRGQIGFRQMRHMLEASYGGLKVQRILTDSGS